MTENVEIAEPKFFQVPVKPLEYVIVSIKIPKGHFDVIKQMVELDTGDTIPGWFTREIVGGVESYVESDCYGSILNDRWKELLNQKQ